MADLVTEFFDQNEWASLRLLEACRALSEEQLDATVPGGYGGIRDTLLHFVAAEGGYVRRLGGTYDGPRAREGEAFPGFDALEQAVRTAAEGLRERAAALTRGEMRVPSSDGTLTVDGAVLLVQAINHGADHRSQICSILTALGLEPPALDAWAWAEATGRFRSA